MKAFTKKILTWLCVDLIITVLLCCLFLYAFGQAWYWNDQWVDYALATPKGSPLYGKAPAYMIDNWQFWSRVAGVLGFAALIGILTFFGLIVYLIIGKLKG